MEGSPLAPHLAPQLAAQPAHPTATGADPAAAIIRAPESADDPWSRALTVWSAGVAAFQTALAAGAPWGAAAWGGAHDGVLPGELRVASGIAALAWAGIGATAAGRGPGPVGRRRTLLGVAIYTSAGVALNAASPSPVERLMWVPLTALGALCAWQAWRAARR